MSICFVCQKLFTDARMTIVTIVKLVTIIFMEQPLVLKLQQLKSEVWNLKVQHYNIINLNIVLQIKILQNCLKLKIHLRNYWPDLMIINL